MKKEQGVNKVGIGNNFWMSSEALSVNTVNCLLTTC